VRGLAAALLLLAAPVALTAMGLRPGDGLRDLERASALFREADFAGAAEVLEARAGRDDAALRELLALRFLTQDLAGVEALASLRRSALDPAARLTAARAAAARADWPACVEHLRALPQPWGPWAQALYAEALHALEHPAAPSALLQALSATAGTRLAAATALWAGEVAEASGDAGAAEARFKLAEKADPSYSMVHARLARLYQAQGRLDDARIRLERARRVDPQDAELRASLNELMAAAPEQAQAQRREQARAVKLFLARSNPSVEPRTVLTGEPLLRVGLLDSAPRFKLVLGGAYAAEGQGRTLPARSAWQVQLARGGGWELRPLSPGAGVLQPLVFSDVLRLQPLDPGSTFGLHDVDHGAGYFWAGKEDRYYRGLAELRPQGAQGTTLVNELGLEAYLLSVVPSEIPSHWPEAALQAQAIAARTEAWRSKGRFAAKGYDLCPTVQCAVYSGVGAEHRRSTYAVTATAGLVLEDERGRLAPTFYMHNSGGHTQEAGEAWSGGEGAPPTATLDAPAGSALAKLFPVTPASLLAFLDDQDPAAEAWTRRSSTWRWTLRFSVAELEASVRRRHPTVPPLSGVQPLQRTAGGYVRRVRFDGAAESIGSSDFIRSAIRGLKSNLFYVEPRLDADGKPIAFLFHGGGWGHGVGLSQAGARAMAEAGHGHDAILKHYFGSERLRRRYGDD
jgi:SpoIID/LytB domain protein